MNPIYSLHMDTLSRSKRRNAVQMAAYVSGQVMTDKSKDTPIVFRRHDTTAIITTGMVGTALDAESLFNRAEKVERRRDSVVSRHINAALPRGLPQETQLQIIRAFAEFLARLLHTAIFWALHLNGDSSKPDNPHAHFLFPTRPWDEATQEFARKKDRLLDSRDTGSHALERIRREWESAVNTRLPAGYRKIDRRSHFRRGQIRHAKRHLGRYLDEWRRRNPGKQHPSEKFNDLVGEHAKRSEQIAVCNFEIEQLEAIIDMAESAAMRAARKKGQALAAEAGSASVPQLREPKSGEPEIVPTRNSSAKKQAAMTRKGVSTPAPVPGANMVRELSVDAAQNPTTRDGVEACPRTTDKVAAERQSSARNLLSAEELIGKITAGANRRAATDGCQCAPSKNLRA